uniref:Uncharacterized protein LOC111136636 isoform X2 n=1 Tax=Crassostrea virginica TaxID=6565 RepID=A0A8B8ETW0_CRAVI|nr:uncharacterized protein LOC111136636 isoform X2 [Crassostrea virginica]
MENHPEFEDDPSVVLVSTAAYFATDALFKSLHGLDNAEFVREFSRIMRKKGSPDTPKAYADENQIPRKRFRHNNTFREEVELLRSMHPEREIVDDNELLNSAHKKWRRTAEESLDIRTGTIGGLMKEAISVACLSRRCYQKAQSIMTLYQGWKLRRQGNNKVNRMLFVQLPGLRNEAKIFDLLCRFEGKVFSKTEFNMELKKAKTTMGTGPKKPDQRDENDQLRKRNEALENRAILLEKELSILRKQMNNSPQQNNDEEQRDVYDFDGSDEEIEEEPTLVLRLLDDDDEEDVADSNPVEEEVDDLDAHSKSKTDVLNSSASSEDGDMFLTVQTPKHTYSRNHGLAASSIDLDADEPERNHEETLMKTLKDLHAGNETKKRKESAQKDKANIPSQMKRSNEYMVDQCVKAKDEGEWFKAKVVATKEGKVKVHYMGYGAQFNKWVSCEEIEPYKFAVGEKVRARWEDDFFYKAVVKEVRGEEYLVLFEDGVEGIVKDIKF